MYVHVIGYVNVQGNGSRILTSFTRIDQHKFMSSVNTYTIMLDYINCVVSQSTCQQTCWFNK